MRRSLISLMVMAALSLGVTAYGNEFYTHGSFPAPGSPATSAGMRAELDLISAGFDKLPSLSGNANKAVIVNGSATALGVTTGTLSLAGNFAISGAFATTLTVTNTTNVTLPTTGTLATLAGAETLTNKTVNLTSNTLTGTVAQFNTALSDGDFATLAGSETLTNKTLTAPILSGSVTGTYTLAGTPTISSPTVNSETTTNPTINGTVSGSAILNPANGGTGNSGTPTNGQLLIGNGTNYTRATLASSGTGTSVTNGAGSITINAEGFSTGDVKLTLKTSADTGWVLMDDGTIGSATSGATTRANADTQTLYSLIWTNCIDQWCPVTGGRGASASADFSANKPLRLPKTLGRALAGYGTGTVQDSGVDGGVDTTNDTLTVPSNTDKWVTGMAVTFTLTSGTITGLTSGNTYYVIRASSTTVKLASNLANAQNGVAIDMTAKSSPVWTITHTYTARALGEAIGEGQHAMSSSELLSHTHTYTQAIAPGSADGVNPAPPYASTTSNSGSTGGNAAMNIMQPTLFLNVMIKLHRPWVELQGVQ